MSSTNSISPDSPWNSYVAIYYSYVIITSYRDPVSHDRFINIIKYAYGPISDLRMDNYFILSLFYELMSGYLTSRGVRRNHFQCTRYTSGKNQGLGIGFTLIQFITYTFKLSKVRIFNNVDH